MLYNLQVNIEWSSNLMHDVMVGSLEGCRGMISADGDGRQVHGVMSVP